MLIRAGAIKSINKKLHHSIVIIPIEGHIQQDKKPNIPQLDDDKIQRSYRHFNPLRTNLHPPAVITSISGINIQTVPKNVIQNLKRLLVSNLQW